MKATQSPPLLRTRRIFVVHGHDTQLKDSVARLVERLGFEAVILHEQENRGRTILQKFLDESDDAVFAIVILTPDDVGAVKSDQPALHPRARQNVVFEFGYFVGKIGRSCVVALHYGDVELPSDLHGLLYIPVHRNNDEWKLALVREMKAAGLEADANRI